MFFLSPIWLAAMAGIVLPVAVHFWNDRRGKVLRIGSIRLLEGSSPRMAWSRRISQWWLLLVRCLLVMALAFLLARPFWVSGGRLPKGWVLADMGAVRVYGGRIDSLVKEGWEKYEMGASDYWEAFRAADRVAPGEVPFVVFSSGLANRFVGQRPYTGRIVHWDVYAPDDSVREWVEKAWPVAQDSVQVVRAVTRRTGSVYRVETVAAAAAAAAAAAVGVAVDTSVMRVSISSDPAFQRDAKYLEAGLKAVQVFTRRRVEVRMGVEGGGAWLFWLSSKPVPVGMGFERVWQYGAGEEKKVDTWMEGTGLYKEVGMPGFAGEVIWADGFGRGVLSREGRRFHFYSRLDPDWGGLVWSRQFPALLARLLFGEEGFGKRDLRMMDVAQVAPLRDGRAVAGEVDRRAGGVDLGPACWVLIFLLFILERWLSGKE